MKHYQKLLVLTLLCSLTPLLTLAQKNTYNFKQAVAALNNQDIAKAKKLIFMDMGGNTKDPYDLFLLSLAYSIEKNVDSAFISIDQAIKYMPKSDETYLYQAYNYRAKLCETCNDSEKQLATYNDMVKALPKNVEALLLRAKFYANELEDYKHSKADLQKALQLDAGNLDAMYTLGDLEFVQKNCDKAIDCYTKVLTANPNYVEARLHRSIAYNQLDKQDASIEDLMELIKQDDTDGYDNLLARSDSAEIREIIIKKLNARAAADPTNGIWKHVLGSVYDRVADYPKAVAAYKEAFAIDKAAVSAYNVANTYYLQNLYQEALEWIGKAEAQARKESENMQRYFSLHANIYDDMGRYDEAIKQFTMAADANPEETTPLWDRAFTYMKMGKLKEALKDINAYDEKTEHDNGLVYLYRGWIYQQLGNTMNTEGDFRKAIETDSIGTPSAATFIAQHFLHLDKQALESLNKSLQEDTSAINYFSAACFYAIKNDKPMAMRQIEIAVEKGYNSWSTLRDFPFLKNMHGYKPYDDFILARIK